MDIRDSLDIRNIQALHAQYAEDPVVIDLASHVAAIPSLPGPAQATANAGILRLRKGAARLARPTIIGLAILALAGGAGMSAAKLWKVMHVTASPTAAASMADRALDTPAGPSASQRSPSQSDSQDAAPINAAPARPLTSTDLASATAANPLARVNLGNLLAAAPTATTGRALSAASGGPGTQQTEVDARVAASPIRASSRLSSMEKQAGTAAVATTNSPATPDATPAGPAATQPVAPAAPHAASVVYQGSAAAVVVAVSPAAAERAAPASRPVTRPVRHTPAQRTAPKQEAHDDVASQVAPTRSPTSAGKSADVQLF